MTTCPGGPYENVVPLSVSEVDIRKEFSVPQGKEKMPLFLKGMETGQIYLMSSCDSFGSKHVLTQFPGSLSSSSGIFQFPS